MSCSLVPRLLIASSDLKIEAAIKSLGTRLKVVTVAL